MTTCRQCNRPVPLYPTGLCADCTARQAQVPAGGGYSPAPVQQPQGGYSPYGPQQGYAQPRQGQRFGYRDYHASRVRYRPPYVMPYLMLLALVGCFLPLVSNQPNGTSIFNAATGGATGAFMYWFVPGGALIAVVLSIIACFVGRSAVGLLGGAVAACGMALGLTLYIWAATATVLPGGDAGGIAIGMYLLVFSLVLGLVDGVASIGIRTARLLDGD